MILKTFQSKNFKFENHNFYLLYGENEGFKKEFIENHINNNVAGNRLVYDEKTILENYENTIESLLSNSFFEEKKIFFVDRCTDKILFFIEEIISKNISDLVVVLKSGILEKKSKLRSFFEKNEKTVCVPFYQDDNKTLSSIVNNFFKVKKISVSQETINIIVERSRGERQNLNMELDKIGNFILSKNRITTEEVIKITNLSENYSVTELIDSCLKKNLKKTTNILNENNYSSDDCILIIRTLLMRSKRLLNIKQKQFENIDIDKIINDYKPPVFWKEKDTVKKQIIIWTLNEIKELIYQINEIEILIKKNLTNSLNILSDFLINKSKKTSNN